MVIELAVTVLPVPTVFEANVAVPLAVRLSPATRSSPYVTEAAVVPSYVLLVAVIVTVRVLTVMFTVVVVDVGTE